MRWLTSRGHGTVDEVVAAGLAHPADRGSARDRFRNRLMFPIQNETGKIIGYGGRALAAEDDAGAGFSYVPIDPCQGVITALRVALGERIAREFIDMETPRFEAQLGVFPDPYALKRVSPEGFAAAVLSTSLDSTHDGCSCSSRSWACWS